SSISENLKMSSESQDKFPAPANSNKTSKKSYTLIPTSDDIIRQVNYIVRQERKIIRRSTASLIDGLLILGTFWLTRDFLASHSNQILVLSLYFISIIFYFSALPACFKGTLGQLALGLRCIRADGEKTEFTTYINRIIALLFPLFIFFTLQFTLQILNTNHVGYSYFAKYSSMWLEITLYWVGICILSCAFSPERRGFHDRLSKTMIIYLRKETE
ncbi:MAG: RDD family protein, partial [Pseudomonadota bacterium]